MSWFLYIITEDFTDSDGVTSKSGDAGVGMCSMSSGIMEAPYGIMYVVPELYIREYLREKNHPSNKHPSASMIRKAIEEYYNRENIIEISNDDKDFFLD
jgi:hypothetical protein